MSKRPAPSAGGSQKSQKSHNDPAPGFVVDPAAAAAQAAGNAAAATAAYSASVAYKQLVKKGTRLTKKQKLELKDWFKNHKVLTKGNKIDWVETRKVMQDTLKWLDGDWPSNGQLLRAYVHTAFALSLIHI